jgi:hypothetical protein
MYMYVFILHTLMCVHSFLFFLFFSTVTSLKVMVYPTSKNHALSNKNHRARHGEHPLELLIRDKTRISLSFFFFFKEELGQRLVLF